MENLTASERQRLVISISKQHQDGQILGDPTGTMNPDAYRALVGAITSYIVLSVANGDQTISKSVIRSKVADVVESGPHGASSATMSLICEQVLRETPVAALVDVLQE